MYPKKYYTIILHNPPRLFSVGNWLLYGSLIKNWIIFSYYRWTYLAWPPGFYKYLQTGWDTLTPKKDNSPLSCWFSRLQNPFSFILKLVNLQVLRPHLYGLKYPRQPSSSRLLCVMRHFGSWKLQQLTPY